MSTTHFPSPSTCTLPHPLDALYDLVQNQALVPLSDVLALGRYYRGFLLLYNRLRKQGLLSERESSRLFFIGFHQGFQAHLAEYLDIVDPYDIRYSVEIVFETAVDLLKHRRNFPPSPRTPSPLVDLISFNDAVVSCSTTLPSSISTSSSSPLDSEDIPYIPFESLVPISTPSPLPVTPFLVTSLAPATAPLIVNTTADSASSNSSLPITDLSSSSPPLSPVQEVYIDSTTITLEESSCPLPISSTDDHITNSLTLESVIPAALSQPLLHASSSIVVSSIPPSAPSSLDFTSHSESHSSLDQSNTLCHTSGSSHHDSSHIPFSPHISTISEDPQASIPSESVLIHPDVKNNKVSKVSSIVSPAHSRVEQETDAKSPIEFKDSPIPPTTHPPGLSFHELPLPCTPNCQPTLSVRDTTINHFSSAGLIPSTSSTTCVSWTFNEYWVLISPSKRHFIVAQLLLLLSLCHRARLKVVNHSLILRRRGFNSASRSLSSHTGPPCSSTYLGS